MRNLTFPLLLSSLLLGCGGDDNAPPGPDVDTSTIDSGTTPDMGGGTPDTGGGTPDTGGGTPDAPVVVGTDGGGMVGIYDFSCAGAPTPPTAGDPLTVSGNLTDFQSMAAINGASVEGRLRSDDSVLDTDTTTSTGAFSLSAATGGVPIDAYLFFSAASYPNTYLYPPDPLAMDLTGFGAGTISSSTLNLIYTLFAPGGHAAGTGTEVVIVTDCAGTAIEGASVTFAPAPGTMAYLAGTLPSTTATATDASGVALGLNAAAGDVTVSAVFMGVSLESHTIEITADGLSATIMHP
jgi:hypothetical protein